MNKRTISDGDRERGKRIAHVRSLMGLGQEELSALLRLSRGAVGNWELGQGIHIDNLAKLAKLSGVSFVWLYSGDGNRPEGIISLKDRAARLTDEPAISQRIVVKGRPYNGDLPDAIPEIETMAGAGPGGYEMTTPSGQPMLNGDLVKGEIVLPPYLLSEFTPTLPGYVHAVRVKGDSMEPSLLSGDRVFVDTADRMIGQGGIFVIFDQEDAEVLVKRLRRSSPGMLEIVSDNPKEGPPRVVGANTLVIIGRAVGRISRL